MEINYIFLRIVSTMIIVMALNCYTAMICDTHNHLTLLKWPDHIDSCENAHHNPVKVVLEKKNNMEYKVKAVALRVRTYRCVTKKLFFGSIEEDKQVLNKH